LCCIASIDPLARQHVLGREEALVKRFGRSLYLQVITAVIIGALLGHFYPAVGASMKPLGEGFIKLVKMLIAPIVFATVVTGIAKMGDLKKVGRFGLKAIIYFEALTTVALLIGLVVGKVLTPGAGMNVDPATLDMKALASYTAPSAHLSTMDFIMNIIPKDVADAFARGDILQVLFFSILFGVALGARLAHLVLVPNPAHRARGDFSLVADEVRSNAGPRYTYAGIAVVSPRLVESVTPGEKAPLAPLLYAAADRGLMSGELYHGLWQDVGTRERLAELEALLESRHENR
jgi:hypothetical protein